PPHETPSTQRAPGLVRADGPEPAVLQANQRWSRAPYPTEWVEGSVAWLRQPLGCAIRMLVARPAERPGIEGEEQAGDAQADRQRPRAGHSARLKTKITGCAACHGIAPPKPWDTRGGEGLGKRL